MIGDEMREALIKADDKGQTVFDRLKCSHCGGMHDHACPRVKSLRFRPTSGGGQTLVEVTFWADGEWSKDGIIFPWHVFAGVRTPTPELSSPESTESQP